jgi:hypothetical protein
VERDAVGDVADDDRGSLSGLVDSFGEDHSPLDRRRARNTNRSVGKAAV